MDQHFTDIQCISAQLGRITIRRPSKVWTATTIFQARRIITLPPEKVAIGFLATPNSARNYTGIPAIEDALRYLIEGKTYSGAGYVLRQKAAYPKLLGAMFWAINEDRNNNYKMSNAIGPFLHHME